MLIPPWLIVSGIGGIAAGGIMNDRHAAEFIQHGADTRSI